MATFTLDENKITEICKLHGAVMVGIFGSYARGEAREDSDVDLLVRFKQPVSLLAISRLRLELMDALGKDIDLITEAGLHPYLREKVFSEIRIIYEAPAEV